MTLKCTSSCPQRCITTLILCNSAHSKNWKRVHVNARFKGGWGKRYNEGKDRGSRISEEGQSWKQRKSKVSLNKKKKETQEGIKKRVGWRRRDFVQSHGLFTVVLLKYFRGLGVRWELKIQSEVLTTKYFIPSFHELDTLQKSMRCWKLWKF